MVAKTIHVSRSSRVRWLKKFLIERVFASEVSEIAAVALLAVFA